MIKPIVFATAIAVALTFPAAASEVHVTVTGIDDPGGQIGCALHDPTTEFPMGQNALRMVWAPPTGPTAVCVFKGISPGTYAVSIANDLNGNKRTDTNVIGIPTEEWGVSRNVRPTLRAPRFIEAAFELGQSPVAFTVEVD